MKKVAFLLIIGISFCATSYGQQTDRNRTVNSFTEWIEEINNWPDDVYRQYDLTVLFDLEKDQQFVGRNPDASNKTNSNTQVSINKKVVLYGARFPSFGISNPVIIQNLNFQKDFILYNLKNDRLILNNITFNQLCQIRLVESSFFLVFLNSQFNGPFAFNNPLDNVSLNISNCQFENGFSLTSSNTGVPILNMDKSSFHGYTQIGNNSTINGLQLTNCYFDLINLGGIINNAMSIVDTDFEAITIQSLNPPEKNTYLSFDQIKDKLYTSNNNSLEQRYNIKSPDSYKNKLIYDQLNAQYTMLKSTYMARGDQDSYNACYVEMKDFETKRLKFLYENNNSFDAYFTLKINQFLKVFSDYGTRPSKAIIFSMYVILAFALVYLFFPNYWDSHGKNRIVDRYSFFLKYMKRDAGMQDVYLDDKKSEILAYQDYKELIESSGKDVPKFFQATALPMYKWAISGTKLTAAILSRIDVMKGTWSELPQSKRVWKSVLLISAFLIALLYDIFIKMLNALMLSINTFTTLGFGEIPIKGLPRYLAIIQGFIGWFMLTIFSVSLISQLLN